MAEPERPKIIVDSDWKSQAQAEKERLAKAEKEATKDRPAQGGAGKGIPEADFPSLVGTLVTQALLYMGAFPDPQTGRAVVSLEYAKFHIDLLAVLEEKTAGNLTEQDAEDLRQALHELRLRYVELTKAVAAMVQREQQGGAGEGPGGAGPGGGFAGGGFGDLPVS